jgi:phosphoglycerate dehydrogenase-like enzyme
MRIALKSRIANRHAKVGIIGLGYVGLPLAQVFVRAGYKMLGLKPPFLSSQSVESAPLSSPVTPSQPSPGPAARACGR